MNYSRQVGSVLVHRFTRELYLELSCALSFHSVLGEISHNLPQYSKEQTTILR